MNKTEFPKNFICAGTEFSTRDCWVAAPFFRKKFELTSQDYEKIERAEILIGACGFYELYVNGDHVTKGMLAPYISAPDDLVYYDKADVTDSIRSGKNVIGVWLGNGFQNNPGGYPWDFEKASWRGAPSFAMDLVIQLKDGERIQISTDEDFVTASSPILFDDYRIGEVYDAREEKDGWNLPEYEDDEWNKAMMVRVPGGEARICGAEPVRPTKEYRAVEILKLEGGWLFDFGVNNAGVSRLKLEGRPGQRIVLHHGEHLQDGKLDLLNTSCRPGQLETNVDVYICRGGLEEYQPRFTYHGFQYVFAEGLTEDQVSEDTITYIECHSVLKERGGFACSMERVNRIQEAVRRSSLSNFFYFPNDCPQREKNGWTADAALSAEHMLLNLEPEHSYREWLRSFRKVQTAEGALPGIIPTAGWGFEWGNGPAWDSALTWIPYYVYLYRGDTHIVRENAHAILAYLEYLAAKRREDGLIAIGLGDWAHVGRNMDAFKAPLEVTDTLVSLDIASKAEFLFSELHMEAHRRFAARLKEELREAARRELVDPVSKLVKGSCQTCQALALAVGLFEENQRQEAFEQLRSMIQKEGGNMDVGVIGGRFLFHILSEFGYSNLAFNMIAKPDYPSYGNWIERGATTLWEDFQPEGGAVNSLNHHFWGDVSHWFLERIAGIHYGRENGHSILRISPVFIEALDWAEGWHLAPEGKIAVRWDKKEGLVKLKLEVPESLNGIIRLEEPACFGDGSREKTARSGLYEIFMNNGEGDQSEMNWDFKALKDDFINNLR